MITSVQKKQWSRMIETDSMKKNQRKVWARDCRVYESTVYTKVGLSTDLLDEMRKTFEKNYKRFGFLILQDEN